MAALFTQISIGSNKLLIVHVLYLYQKHLADFFLATPNDFNHVIGLIFTLFGASSSGDIENNPVHFSY